MEASGLGLILRDPGKAFQPLTSAHQLVLGSWPFLLSALSPSSWVDPLAGPLSFWEVWVSAAPTSRLVTKPHETAGLRLEAGGSPSQPGALPPPCCPAEEPPLGGETGPTCCAVGAGP